MADEQQRWHSAATEDGAALHTMKSWSDLPDFLERVIFRRGFGQVPHRLLWRGHRESEWRLNSSLDRLFERLNYFDGRKVDPEQRAAEHLEDFKYAARGRRRFGGQMSENEWWALGQHFGLATPLLDWTHSPFVAAYFAFEEPTATSENRVIFALDRDAVQIKNAWILEELDTVKKDDERPPILELIDPLSDENPRLVSQGALFTRGLIGITVDTWVTAYFSGSELPVLHRIEIPSRDRIPCLRMLDTMNINHLSLFPDLVGASRATNLKTELDLIQR